MWLKLLVFCIGFVLGVVTVFAGVKLAKNGILSPLSDKTDTLLPKPLEKYTFSSLQKTQFTPSTITLGKKVKEDEEIASYLFYFNVKDDKTGVSRKVSGLMNLPKKPGNYPLIVMLRGFVDKAIYQPGVGTSRAGEVFARNGYITLAPDFLGYGESDNPSVNSIEERFQTYTTALTLFVSLSNLPVALQNAGLTDISADSQRVGIWGHSNGGHIALSILAVTGKAYPTVLWAPVSKPFPYSILYFTDEFEDHGKALRKVVADFETDYDIEKYSPTNYYQWIKAPIQIHQGMQDDAVPLVWSDQLSTTLEDLGVDIEYFTYSNADHNLMPGGWATAVDRSLGFYGEHLR